MKILRVIGKAPFTVRTWKSFGYMWASLLPSALAFAIALVGLVAVFFSAFGIGLPLLVLDLFLSLLALSMFRPIGRVFLQWQWEFDLVRRDATWIRRSLSILRRRDAWGALLYCFLKFPLTLTITYLGTVAVVGGVIAITFPLSRVITETGWPLLHERSWLATFMLAAQGIVAILIFPWMVRLGIIAEKAIVSSLIAPSDDRRRIAQLRASRREVAEDAVMQLSRIERDLHDGTQARLVALGMLTSRLRDRIDNEGSIRLVESLQQLIEETTSELREIIRGVHPPVLNDGLGNAIASLVERSSTPTSFTGRDIVVPDVGISTALYFVAAELTTNIARHAHASTADVTLSESSAAYVLEVIDNGIGGAKSTPDGTGLDGIRRRLSAVDGTIEVSSPPGGPTRVTITVPKDLP